jgi:hypothetical protein
VIAKDQETHDFLAAKSGLAEVLAGLDEVAHLAAVFQLGAGRMLLTDHSAVRGIDVLTVLELPLDILLLVVGEVGEWLPLSSDLASESGGSRSLGPAIP